MAFGIGKAIKKSWKKTVGKAFDAVKPVLGTVAGALLAPATGGLSLAVGASFDAQRYQSQKQEEMIKAQIASAEKIAAMQNQPVIQAAATPTSSLEAASIAEQNAATAKKKAFSFAKTHRMGSVSRRNTLG